MAASDRATQELGACKWKHIWRLLSGITNTAYILIINNGVLQLESSPRRMLWLSSLLWCWVVSIQLLKPSPSVHCPESPSECRSEEPLNDEVARDGGGCWPMRGQYLTQSLWLTPGVWCLPGVTQVSANFYQRPEKCIRGISGECGSLLVW